MKTDKWICLVCVTLFTCATTMMQAQSANTPALYNNRFLTFNAIIRVNQIEVSREKHIGDDERALHTPAKVMAFRQAIAQGFPDSRITWALSWLALFDTTADYTNIRKLVKQYHKQYGDEVTFIPGAYFSNAYNSREQINKDLHDGLARVSSFMGNGYRPKAIVAGFLAAANQQYLAEKEGIHVCQGNIWSQYSIDNQDGDGSVSYPYYPSKEHFCKPAQGRNDFIDCVNLDGWTMDFLAARRPGFAEGFNSRLGVGPIETLGKYGEEKGLEEMMHTTAIHFDSGFVLNKFGWVTVNWELSLPYELSGLTRWLQQIRQRWPQTKFVTQGEFGLAWRKKYKDNNFNYRFVQTGSGIGGSDADKTIRWFMNKDFRLALLRENKPGSQEKLIDFTRYANTPAAEPATQTRSFSLLGHINMKQTRPQDKPIPFIDLAPDNQQLVKKHYPALWQQAQQNADYTHYVNPFIGTAATGHTFPGATVPFGMVQVSPETGNYDWDYCAGYRYVDSSIWGFAQTHLNGTGVPDLGDILLQPFTGEVKGTTYHSRFSKESEQASPGYYTVTLSDFNVKAELTATAHTAFHQYTYNGNTTPHLLIDLQNGVTGSKESYRNRVLAAAVEFNENNQTITGYQLVNAWVKRQYFYVISFNKPFTKKELLPQRDSAEKAPRYVLDFNLSPGEKLQVKIALSTVSIEGALANRNAELPHWNFNQVTEEARLSWNSYFERAVITGSTEQKANFYTALYHLFIQPNNIADVDGRYRGADDQLHQSNGTYYSTLSLWDTYRAAHPLYTLLAPEKVNGFIQTMLQHADATGLLPRWTLWGKENNCMIGNHAIPVIADAYLKGLRGYDAEKAFAAIRVTSLKDHAASHWREYLQYKYLPFDLIREESVSRSLECNYDDWAAAQMAKALDKQDQYSYFMQRSAYYKNLLDPVTRMMRGRDSKGQWRTPFDVFRLSHAGSAGGDYTEGNAWQYTWSVQHDIKGLTELIGGKQAFINKLDSLYKLKAEAATVKDVTGLIGQYAHGNEPSHHVAYLFTMLNRPERTQELIRQITDSFYLNKPDGLSGNDDCGQMSAWYLFSSMGFYPVNPVGGEYVFGAPQLPAVTIKLPENKSFTVEAKGLSATNKYVKSITLNGKPYNRQSISHSDIIKGGKLVFIMSNSKPAIPQ